MDEYKLRKEKKKRGEKFLALDCGWKPENGKSNEDKKYLVGKKETGCLLFLWIESMGSAKKKENPNATEET